MAPSIESVSVPDPTTVDPVRSLGGKVIGLAAGGAVAVGFLGWALLAEVLGASEPWDSPLYFLLWLPCSPDLLHDAGCHPGSSLPV